MSIKRKLNKAIPDSLKNIASALFGIGPYPKWKAIINTESIKWQNALKNAQNGPRVLVATSVGSHRAGNITESTIAAALTLRGANVHVLLCDKFLPGCCVCLIAETQSMKKFTEHSAKAVGYCTRCFILAAKMYKDLGIKYYRYSELITKEEKSQAKRIAQEVPFNEIGNYTYNGLKVGEHALAGALRFFCTGDLDDESYGEKVLRQYLFSALLTMFATSRLVLKNSYLSSIFFHGIYIPHGIIGEVARANKVRVVNWNTSYRQKRFVFTHDDTYHHMLLWEPVSNWENMPWTEALEKQIMEYLFSREAGSRDWQQFNENANPSIQAAEAELGIDFSKPTIGLLPNVVWDAQLHYRANAFSNLIEWAMKTIEYFSRHPELQLLIRVHPAEIKSANKSRQPLIKEIQKAFLNLPRNIYIIPPESKISTYAVMQKCSAVLVYGTKTGVELTARGIPVIVAGEAWIKNKGLTYDVTTPQEYFEILGKLPLTTRMSKEQITRARKYAFHFFYRRAIYLGFMSKSSDSMSFRLGIKSISELMPGQSMGLDIICDGILHKKEFIYPAELGLEADE